MQLAVPLLDYAVKSEWKTWNRPHSFVLLDWFLSQRVHTYPTNGQTASLGQPSGLIFQ
jgi:hypothetical protein